MDKNGKERKKMSDLRKLIKQLTKEGKTYADYQRGEMVERMRKGGRILGA